MSTEKVDAQDPAVEKKRVALKAAIVIFEKKISDEKVKVSAGEYIRLLELLHEIDDDGEPKEIRARWVDPEPTATEPSTET